MAVNGNGQTKVYLVPNRCLGCEECMNACTKEHGESRNFVMRIAGIPVPLRCAHCKEPSCMAVCPVEAIEKDPETGLVTIDHNKCIQCRNCHYACPYGMISISPTLNKPIKCDLCVDRLEEGISKAPACVEGCALQALFYGTLEDLQDERDKEVAAKAIELGDMITEILAYKEA